MTTVEEAPTAALPIDDDSRSRGGTPAAGRRPPRLADGVELIGEYEGSGYKEPPSLVRRGDGQVVQLTPLLYTVTEKADGRRDYADIASAITTEIGRKVSADNVRFLVEEKLVPLGVLVGADRSA